ncbi:L domain-like protein [Neocallimastix californiae]|uniref:L domain-like protein n=1 Tax=Neocallimastix californiae TaxID=1754190 RepID=A0A1Y1Y481_9FUNG|nr:L domain-like protein [Neocallimastix californiae]|eukprot:ORX92394.1 L domain-like protein [Neocallimastix californiae]
MFFNISLKSIAYVGLISNLALVYAKTDSESKISWKENTNSCCELSGIECSSDRITKIDLRENGFKGSISSEIGALSELNHLYFYTNQLKGSIPDCIGELTNINELCLDNNKLEGNIPSSIGNLSNLKLLDVEKNQLSGIIPESFSKLKNIEKINLQGNSGLIGNLPNVPSIKTCSYANTNLCVKEGSDICTNNLRKCTEEF